MATFRIRKRCPLFHSSPTLETCPVSLCAQTGVDEISLSPFPLPSGGSRTALSLFFPCLWVHTGFSFFLSFEKEIEVMSLSFFSPFILLEEAGSRGRGLFFSFLFLQEARNFFFGFLPRGLSFSSQRKSARSHVATSSA